MAIGRSATGGRFRRRRRSSARAQKVVVVKPQRRGLLSMQSSPLPKKIFTKLKYQDIFTINPGIGTPGVQVFSCNGLFDPNITGTGHQPRGFDQLMAMYDHYVVLGSKITVWFSATLESTLCGVAARDSATVEVDVNEYIEDTVNAYTCMGETGSGAEPKKIVLKNSIRKFLGRSNVMSDSQLKGSSAANPTEQAFYHVYSEALDPALDLGALHCSAEIEYLVALIEPKQPTQS